MYKLTTTEGYVEGRSISEVYMKYTLYKMARFITSHQEAIVVTICELLLIAIGVAILLVLPEEGTVGLVCILAGMAFIYERFKTFVKKRK